MRPQRWLLLIRHRIDGYRNPGGRSWSLQRVKFFVDDVIGKRQPNLILPLVMVILRRQWCGDHTTADAALVQRLARRMVAELRKDVQTHIGRLRLRSRFQQNPALVPRIMSDVERLTESGGDELVEFAGSNDRRVPRWSTCYIPAPS